MADDGMLLNFQIGNGPLLPKVKFKGGSWRDRSIAQKAANRPRPQKLPVSSLGGQSSPSEPQRPLQNDAGGPPAKRQRTDRPRASVHAEQATKGAGGGSSKLHGVTSRLFTSNPEPKTNFEDVPEPQEDLAPTNAPSDTASFAGVGISKRLQDFLTKKLELVRPTAIQSSVIPHLLGREDQDAFIQAQTGSGKTLAYLLPILQRIMSITVDDERAVSAEARRIHRNSGIFAIILAPTRELAKQIDSVLSKLLQCAPWIVCTTVTGGEKKKAEKARIRKGSNILIGTPGRLSDHLNNTKVLDDQLGTVKWLILDEGDRLMEMGFEEDLRNIIDRVRKATSKTTSLDGVALHALPKRRVTVLCSATLKSSVQKLGEISLEDAKYLTSTADETDKKSHDSFQAPAQLKQIYAVVPAKTRLVTLIALLKSTFARRGSVMKAIIFISCADSVNFHFDLLKSSTGTTEGGPARPAQHVQPTADTVASSAYVTSPACPEVKLARLHGSLPQPVRTATLAWFKRSTEPAVLITTDIASRGLDVPDVDLVIEYDPAFALADHVHRIGRTARAGRVGKAVLFLLPGCEEGYVDFLPATPAPTPQLGEDVLRKGLETAMAFPTETDAKPIIGGSYKDQAEALQLHVEQRILMDATLLEAARTGFRSHIRAYATHVKDERGCFDITELHLGHMAKSFGLRETPAGIGLGVHRGSRKRNEGGANQRITEQDDRDQDTDAADMARRMKTRMKVVMNAANEFNIG